jgi:hypothetical protein
MRRWATPTGSSWESPFLWVCFSDECPYYVRGWTWLEQQFGRKASYRHSLDPATGAAGPLPVWSAAALRAEILPDEVASERSERVSRPQACRGRLPSKEGDDDQ